MNLAEQKQRENTEKADQDARRNQKSDTAYRTISEVASELDLPQHVLRFWESKFRQISPLKRGGGRRYYRPQDVDLIRRIHYLLHTQGYTIKGVQKLLSRDRLLQQSVPFLDEEGAARIELDTVLPPHLAGATLAVSYERNPLQQHGAISVAGTPEVAISPAQKPASNQTQAGPMSLAVRTDLQLILNRLKKLRAQAEKQLASLS